MEYKLMVFVTHYKVTFQHWIGLEQLVLDRVSSAGRTADRRDVLHDLLAGFRLAGATLARDHDTLVVTTEAHVAVCSVRERETATKKGDFHKKNLLLITPGVEPPRTVFDIKTHDQSTLISFC